LVFNGDLKSKSDKVGDVHSGAFYAGVQLNLIAFEDEGKSSEMFREVAFVVLSSSSLL
jgi:hypothetical protein